MNVPQLGGNLGGLYASGTDRRTGETETALGYLLQKRRARQNILDYGPTRKYTPYFASGRHVLCSKHQRPPIHEHGFSEHSNSQAGGKQTCCPPSLSSRFLHARCSPLRTCAPRPPGLRTRFSSSDRRWHRSLRLPRSSPPRSHPVLRYHPRRASPRHQRLQVTSRSHLLCRELPRRLFFGGTFCTTVKKCCACVCVCAGFWSFRSRCNACGADQRGVSWSAPSFVFFV